MVMVKLYLVRFGLLLMNPWVFLPVMSLFALFLLRLLHNDLITPKWDIARFPQVADLKAGQYKVVMLPRCLFFWFRNVKRLEMTDGGLGEALKTALRVTSYPLPGNDATITAGFKIGYNLAWRRFRWGSFTIWCKDRSLCLNYRASRFPLSMIRDLVREVEPGVFLGRFMLKVKERYFFVFWFKLIEMETEEAE